MLCIEWESFVISTVSVRLSEYKLDFFASKEEYLISIFKSYLSLKQYGGPFVI